MKKKFVVPELTPEFLREQWTLALLGVDSEGRRIDYKTAETRMKNIIRARESRLKEIKLANELNASNVPLITEKK